MSNLIWYLKQLLPFTYRSTFYENGDRHFCVWNMWMGHCYNIEDYVINENS